MEVALEHQVNMFLTGKINMEELTEDSLDLLRKEEGLQILIRLRKELSYKQNEEIFDRYLELRRKLTVKDGKLDEKILETLWDARIDFQTFQLEKKRIHKQLMEIIKKDVNPSNLPIQSEQINSNLISSWSTISEQHEEQLQGQLKYPLQKKTSYELPLGEIGAAQNIQPITVYRNAPQAWKLLSQNQKIEVLVKEYRHFGETMLRGFLAKMMDNPVLTAIFHNECFEIFDYKQANEGMIAIIKYPLFIKIENKTPVKRNEIKILSYRPYDQILISEGYKEQFTKKNVYCYMPQEDILDTEYSAKQAVQIHKIKGILGFDNFFKVGNTVYACSDYKVSKIFVLESIKVLLSECPEGEYDTLKKLLSELRRHNDGTKIEIRSLKTNRNISEDIAYIHFPTLDDDINHPFVLVAGEVIETGRFKNSKVYKDFQRFWKQGSNFEETNCILEKIEDEISNEKSRNYITQKIGFIIKSAEKSFKKSGQNFHVQQ